EYDKLTQGLFENYLECKFKDPHMDGVSIWHFALTFKVSLFRDINLSSKSVIKRHFQSSI
ncbi:MAG: hypothetical protein AB2705_21570, partial [Candidatus Thiodiazotropha sp.]